MPSFSFIIPVKPGGTVAALGGLRDIDTCITPFEILIAEGCRPSRQRNAAVREASGEILYFLDDDSQISPDCLDISAAALENGKVAVVGGPSLTPAGDSILQKLFGAALASVFGAGAVRNRYRAVGDLRETTDRELILCNMVVRRDVFLSVGGFDERLYPNEENELLGRILAAGHKLLHVPQMSVQRSQRKNIGQFIRQMFSYGRGRAQQTLISGSVSVVSFAPLLFNLYLLLLIFSPLTSFTLAPLATYLLLDSIFTLSAVFTSGVLSRSLLLFVFPLVHVANGCGLFWGLLGGVPKVETDMDDKIVVKRIKTFDQVLW